MKKKSLLLIVVATLGLTAATMAQNVPSYVPTNGLVGWWPFNGNANDESGNGNNGAVIGPSLTTDRFGNANKAYSFDGVNDFIKIDSTLLPGSLQSFTITYWFNKTVNTTIAQAVINDRTTNGYKYYSNFASNNQSNGAQAGIENFSNGVSSYVLTNSGSTQHNGNWNNITWVVDTNNSSMNIYRNGILENTTTLNTLSWVTQDAPTIIGASENFPGDEQYFNGYLDDIGIWNRALTQQEVTDLYNGNICYQTITVTDTLLINMGITGFNPVTYNNTIKIFPNPTYDHITIDYGNFATLSGYQLKIENSLGQQVFQTNINQQSNYLSLNNWGGNGLYFVRIIDPQGNTIDIRKIVLQ